MKKVILNSSILYLTREMAYGGVEKVVMQLSYYFKNEFKKVVVCSLGGNYEKDLKELDVKHYKIGDFENKSLANVIKIIFQLYKIIKVEKITLVHSQHRMGTFYAKILSILTGVKVIHTAHVVQENKKGLTKYVLRNTNIIAVSNGVENNLLNYFNVKAKAIIVIYNGVTNESFEYREIRELKECKAEGYFLVGTICRLAEEKGIKYYIEAALHLLKTDAKVKYVIVGEGDLKEEIINSIEKHNLRNMFIILGFRKDVLNIINQLDLVILPSLREGLPLLPMEVFSQNKTIVATNIEGTNEVITNNVDGLLVEPRNSKQLADAIYHLYSNSLELNNLGENAYNTYCEKFKLENVMGKYKNYYEEILNN
ncbi:glycosyltransferase [Clostridium sp. FP2]|uniref:glycosyltransferase n=1 Tax=Clostridium sp. FP2 TaxID=2724481 RepID=UPI0013E9632D|nr:glycosyltransferase [Clostridium sp. FP2]MBZ9625469.1 glycosyltransferase [Clostridium sp. FP2]